jgi:transposase
MRENDGRKLDRKTLEEIRIRVVNQVENGTRVDDVAAALGFSRATVFAWVAKYNAAGLDGLRARKAPGREPVLSQLQAHRVRGMLLDADPRRFGHDQGLWTRELVRELIQDEFAITLSPSSVNRLLRRLGLTPPNLRRGADGNEPNWVEHWKRTEHPKVATWMTQSGAVLYFASASGSGKPGGRACGHRARARAERASALGGGEQVTVVSAGAGREAVRFAAYRGGWTCRVLTDFCDRLLHDAGRPVVLVVRRHPDDQPRTLATYVAGMAGRLALR